MWFTFACFGVSFGDVSPDVCCYTFSSVKVAKWPPFGEKKLPAQLAICSLCIFIYFPFCF